MGHDLGVIAELLPNKEHVACFGERGDVFDIFESMSCEDRDRILLRSLAARVLKYLEDERIFLFDLPHLIEEVCCWSASTVGTLAPDASCYVSGDAVSKGEFDVMRKVL